MPIIEASQQVAGTGDSGPIDCDIHPAVPALATLLPYLPEAWRETLTQRGLHELDSISYPSGSPLSVRPDWRPAKGKAGADVGTLIAEAVVPFGSRAAICNCLYGVHLLHSEDMAAALAAAVNDWIAHELLDRDRRLCASIVVPVQSPQLSAQEIDRCAGNRRFVQVLVPVLADAPLGARAYWPIYEAAERHALPVGIHAGSMYHYAPTTIGWPTYHTEEYVAQSQAFQAVIGSLVCEGVFNRFPKLRVVLIESGLTWLPACLWRLDKYWQALRWEIPWVDRPPTAIVRERVRLTLQPADIPPDRKTIARFVEHLGSEELLLFSTDYPHWQFDGLEAMPEGLPADLVRKIQVENPLQTYPRLRGGI